MKKKIIKDIFKTGEKQLRFKGIKKPKFKFHAYAKDVPKGSALDIGLGFGASAIGVGAGVALSRIGRKKKSRRKRKK